MKPNTLTFYLLLSCAYRRIAKAARAVDGAWKATSVTCSRMAYTLLRTWRAMMRDLIGTEVAA